MDKKKFKGGAKEKDDFLLTTPYNFVPLSRKVVRPEWAHLISHDRPFKNGQSGQFTLHIKAEQPIFMRNNVSRRITDEAEGKRMGSQFSKDGKDRYFIPGSSIKGTIRNVLEIMSFGDLSKGLNDEIWGMRDLTLEAYKELFSWDSKVHCGWLRKIRENNYIIDDCGIPYRITHRQIDEHFEGNILLNWARGFEKTNDPKKKYLKYNFSKGTAKIKTILFDGKDLKGTYSDVDGNEVEGELVFTGQPTIKFDEDNKGTINVFKDESIKYKEFIFGNNTNELTLNDEVVKAFEFAYTRLHIRPTDKPLPVFFHKNDKGEVASFGLAYMYKIPFTHSIKEAIQTIKRIQEMGLIWRSVFSGIQKKTML